MKSRINHKGRLSKNSNVKPNKPTPNSLLKILRNLKGPPYSCENIIYIINANTSYSNLGELLYDVDIGVFYSGVDRYTKQRHVIPELKTYIKRILERDPIVKKNYNKCLEFYKLKSAIQYKTVKITPSLNLPRKRINNTPPEPYYPPPSPEPLNEFPVYKKNRVTQQINLLGALVPDEDKVFLKNRYNTLDLKIKLGLLQQPNVL